MNTEQLTYPQIHPDGLSPIDQAALARQARREERLSDLRDVRRCAGVAIRKVTHYIDDHGPHEEAEPFKLRDLTISLKHLEKEFRQIVALENWLDDSAEAHAARIAEETAEREAAARAEQHRLEEQPLEDKKDLIRQAVKLAHRDAHRGQPRIEREELLRDLFEDYEEFGDFSEPPEDIVAGFCEDFAKDPDADLSDIPDFAEDYGDETDPDKQRKIRCRSWARSCLHHIARLNEIDAAQGIIPDPGDAPPTTGSNAQGPPAPD